jgi:hypothetical protein
VQDGKLVAPIPPKVGVASLAQPRSFLGYGPNGYFANEIGPFKSPAERQKFVEGLAGNAGSNSKVRLQGVGGLAQLLKGGVDVHQATAITKQGFRAGDQIPVDGLINAAAVAGVSSDHKTLFLMIQEGDGLAKPRKGASAGQLAKILLGLGAWDAVMMDNGGSAQIYIPGAGANNRPGGSGRLLPNWIVF